MEILNYIGLIDKNILIFINQTLSFPFFDFIMPIITNEHNWMIPILSLILYMLLFDKIKGRIVLTVLIITLGINDYFCASILKPYFSRLRPSHEFLEYINLLVPKGGKWSFPSNHASNMFALATTLGYFYPKIKNSLYFLAIIVCFSRVYVGVHYPFDVLIGGIVGYSISWIIINAWVELKLKMFKRNHLWVWHELREPDH